MVCMSLNEPISSPYGLFYLPVPSHNLSVEREYPGQSQRVVVGTFTSALLLRIPSALSVTQLFQAVQAKCSQIYEPLCQQNDFRCESCNFDKAI